MWGKGNNCLEDRTGDGFVPGRATCCRFDKFDANGDGCFPKADADPGICDANK